MTNLGDKGTPPLRKRKAPYRPQAPFAARGSVECSLPIARPYTPKPWALPASLRFFGSRIVDVMLFQKLDIEVPLQEFRMIQ